MKPLIKIMALLLFCFTISQSFAAENLYVEFDEAQVNKSTKPGSSWNFMDVNLYLAGDGQKDLRWYYDPIYTKASTESMDVRQNEDSSTKSYLWRLKEVDKDNGRTRLWERFKAPAGQDKYLSIEGYVDVYTGEMNKYIEIEDYLPKSGKAIKHPILEKNNIEFCYLTRDDVQELKKKKEQKKEGESGNPEKDMELIAKAFSEAIGEIFSRLFGMNDADLTFLIKGDPDKILNIALINEKGESIETTSRSISRDEKTGVMRFSVNYRKMLPYRGKIRIYLNDGKSITRIPFKYRIALP